MEEEALPWVDPRWEDLLIDVQGGFPAQRGSSSEEAAYPDGSGFDLGGSWSGATSSEQWTSSGSEGGDFGATPSEGGFDSGSEHSTTLNSEVSAESNEFGATPSDGGFDSGSENSTTLSSEFSAGTSEFSTVLSAPDSPTGVVDIWSRRSHPAALPPPPPPPIGWQNQVGGMTAFPTDRTQSAQPDLAAGWQPLRARKAATGVSNTGVVPAQGAFLPALPTHPQEYLPPLPQPGTGLINTGFHGIATSGGSSDGCPVCPVCPLCTRQCEPHHTLGAFWRKFGYDGPAYCSRCSSLFRAHIVSRTVSTDKCTRDHPCARCALILRYFKVTREEAFAAMDSSDAKKQQVQQAPGGADVIACPHCADQVPAATLGLFWRKFGYNGMPYCANCSARFRNHIIRQRSTKTKDCCRAAPCTVCDSILLSFAADRATTFVFIDNKTRAPLRGSTAAPTSRRRSSSGSGGGGGDTGPPAPDALDAKRPKLNGCNWSSRGGLIGSLPLAVVGVLAFCAVAGMIDLPDAVRTTQLTGLFGESDHKATTAYNCCHGGVNCGFEHCPALGAGQDGCVRRWNMPNGMNFDTDCGVPGAGDRSNWCRGGVFEGVDKDTVAKCFGPPHSTCKYSCLPGYIVVGSHFCHEGEQVYSGGHCEPDPHYSPFGGPAQTAPTPYNCCGGGVGCGWDHCPALGAGQDGCVRRFDMPNGMDFDTDCGVPGAGDRSNWCRGGVFEGVDKDTVAKCFGPPHSTCKYSCLPGYIDTEWDHTCFAGEKEFEGGACRPAAAPPNATADPLAVV